MYKKEFGWRRSQDLEGTIFCVICTIIYVFILFLWTPTRFYTDSSLNR